VIEVNVTSTDFSVVVTDSVSNITVTADNSLFTVTSVVSNVTVTNVTPVITFETEGFDFDFAIKHRGEWIPNNDYTRNDVVRYENSIYICQIQFNVILNSNIPPLNDTNSWELFYWNQWPKQYLTITNWLDVGTDIEAGGNLTVGGNAEISGTTTLNGDTTINADVTINGTLQGISEFIANTGTFNTTLSVGANSTTNGTFYINGLRYPSNKGIYGQVLFTGGEETSQAAWVNLGELQAWSLNEDLYTNGFNIVTGIASDGTRPELTIGNGETGNFRANINFPTTGQRINLDANFVDINGNLDVDDNIEGRNITALGNMRIPAGLLQGLNPTTAVELEYGIKFPDGTIQTSASTSTGFTITQIASASRLGVIRVGQYLEIDEDTGVLTVDVDALPANYTLPAASTTVRGGIKVGQGLVITDGDVLNVSTTTEYSNVSLLQDMRTNGYKIKYSTSENAAFLRVDIGTIELRAISTVALEMQADLTTLSNNEAIVLDSEYTQIGPDVNTSELRVQNIYNHAGTSAPFFPAGVQYQDNTIQRTAWRGYDQGLI
jgi:hypothetical protein